MATRLDVRQAIGGLLDELSPFMPRTITATASAGTTVDADELKAMPADSTLFVGGFARNSSGDVRYITTFDRTNGRWTVTPAWGTNPVAATKLEYWRSWNPAQIDDRIEDSWNELRRTAWVPDVRVYTVYEFQRYFYGLPAADRTIVTNTNWNGVTLVQFAPNQPKGGVDHSDLYDFQALKSLSSNQKGAQGFKFDDADEWIRYVAVYMGHVGTLTSSTITLSIQADTAGSASGTDLVTGTRSADLVHPVPQWVVFQLSRPFRAVANTQYHIVLSLSTAVDASNYIQVGHTEDNKYDNGTFKKYDGAAWTDLSKDMLFLLYKEQGGWTELYGNEWELEPDRQIELRPSRELHFMPDLSLIRLTGTRYPDAPNDTDNIELPFDWLVYNTAALLAASRLQAPARDPDRMDERLRLWVAKAQAARMTVQRRKPAGTKTIFNA